MVSVEEIKKMDHKTKIRIGLVMGIFCALYWGVWYVPGTSSTSSPTTSSTMVSAMTSRI